VRRPDEQREQIAANWQRAAGGWRRQADSIQAAALPVSVWMIEHLGLGPGQRVLELAAGPGDTGFMAAELIAPGGELICSDASEPMLDIARARAAEQGIGNVEFVQLELVWIDLPAADVDAILCRWGVMLTVDPDAALRECRRVLRPGGRIALAVWDARDANPWLTLPQRATVELGYAEPPPAGGPGPFALSAPGALTEKLEEAGFVEVLAGTVAMTRRYESVEGWLDETLDTSPTFAGMWRRLSGEQRETLQLDVAERAAPFTTADGSIVVAGSCLMAAAEA
jgi:SAM-dependent methyltransferase